ncbi:MAG: hypothetical protein OEY44_01055, partial [Candidatus Peregrinibacteria bacterium]|nr:hypothetical protein [Candidatus Peregrinibacteria bacterium]
ISSCNDYEITREEIVTIAVKMTDPSHFMGMNLSLSIYDDILFAGPVDEAWWLGLIDWEPSFRPTQQADDCFVQEVFRLQRNLPSIYGVEVINTADTSVEAGVQRVATKLDIWGTSAGTHLPLPLRIVNNLDGDFSTPVPTTAIQSILIRCNDGGVITEATANFINGVAEFTNLDCWDAGTDGFALQVNVNFSPLANSGDMAMVGIDGTTLNIRGAARDYTQTFTIL